MIAPPTNSTILLKKQADDRTIDLMIHLCLVHFALFFKIFLHSGKLLLKLFAGNEAIQAFRPLTHGELFSAHGFTIGFRLFQKNLTEGIQPRQIFSGKASGLLCPFFFPLSISPDPWLPGQ